MKLVSRFDSKAHPAVLSPWSIIHFAAGGLARKHEKSINLFLAELIHAAYEFSGGKDVFEQFGFDVKHPSSTENNFADQGVFTLGWYFAPKGWPYEILVPVGFAAFSYLKIGFIAPTE